MENQPLDSQMGGRMPEVALQLIKTLSGWTKFLGILGAVLIALFVILAFTMGTFFATALANSDTPMPTWFFTVVYLLIALLYFFPVYYLLMFSKHAKRYNQGFADEDGIKALGFMKSFFKFYGILTIIFLGIYAIAFVGGLMGGAFA